MLRDHHSNEQQNSIYILCIECSITQKYNNEAKTRKEAKNDDNDAKGNQSLTTNEEQPSVVVRPYIRSNIRFFFV